MAALRTRWGRGSAVADFLNAFAYGFLNLFGNFRALFADRFRDLLNACLNVGAVPHLFGFGLELVVCLASAAGTEDESDSQAGQKYVACLLYTSDAADDSPPV